MKTETRKPPAHLCAKSKAYFKKFLEEFECDDSNLEVLIRACESSDRADEAAAGLKKAGSLLAKDRFGCDRANPLVQIERQARAAFIDAIKISWYFKRRKKKNDRNKRKVF